MPINPDAAGAKGEPERRTWTSKDALLYAVGVGAGHEPLEELQFTSENSRDVTQQALPTMAVVLTGGLMGAMANLGSFNPAMLVHGEQGITLHRPLPVEGELESVGELTGVYDKGKGALVVVEATATLVATGEKLFTNRFSAFIRGEGGWGGDRGPTSTTTIPERDPDHSVTYTTRPEQALLYRLSGDRNPLHSDPAFAEMAGFDRPILHGLCTYGFTGRALLHRLADSDPTAFTSMDAWFSSPVFPGESLTVNMWTLADGQHVFRTHGQDGRVVIDGGRCTTS